MWKKLILIVVFALLVLPENGLSTRIEVMLWNGTANRPLGDYPFTIEIRNSEGRVIQKKEMRTASDGRYTLSTPVDKPSVFVEVNYRGVNYEGKAMLSKGIYRVEIPVYEITDREDMVKVMQRTAIISLDSERSISVFEILHIRNGGKRTFVGRFNDELDLHQVLYLSMPEGYRLTHLQGLDPRKVVTYRRAVVTQAAIPPGDREYILGYTITSDRGVFSLAFKGETRVTLLLNEREGWQINPSGFKNEGKTNAFGRSYNKLVKTKDKAEVVIYSPLYKPPQKGWISALFFGTSLSLFILYIMKNNFRRYLIRREVKKLQDLISFIRTDGDALSYYAPFIRIIEDRIEQLERIGNGPAGTERD